jgi:hypothetical protein
MITGCSISAFLAQVGEQHGGAAVDEALGQALVQGVRHFLLDGAARSAICVGLVQPIVAVGDIGPGAHAREPIGQRVDVALHLVEPRELLGIPALRDAPVPPVQEVEQAGDQAGMLLRPGLAEIGQPAGGPEPPHRPLPAHLAQRRVGGQCLQHGQVDRFGSGAQAEFGRAALEGADQRLDAAIIGFAVAPVEEVQGREAVVLDRVHFLVAKLGQRLASMFSVPNVPSRW